MLAVSASKVFPDELMHAPAAKEEQSWDAVVAFKEGQSCDDLMHGWPQDIRRIHTKYKETKET